ncbi:copper resistance CopC family protein [Kribbella albertanoniae]|uniref:Copper resistance protein CopC n=1 Tax=Kribbella albertanoniae TaxID=1266829 RepID=A0A4R4Q5Y5_9ACTN|nr:copper resistance CopC family protein [Kribbella albertanoniae]TDC30544.1 copper resistance protein CopC [Kribbella albertanoniae]
MRRLTALLVVSLLALVVSTGPAAAHAKLESMTPADGSSMPAPPTKVVLTFNEPVGSNGTQIQVKSPAGVNVATGNPQVLDKTVTQPVGAMIEAGRYQVEARVVSADGHPITVSAGFTITHAGHAPDAPPVDPTTNQPPNNSNTVTVVAMCLVMLVVVALAIVIVRRRPAR